MSKPQGMGNEFTCDACGGTFPMAWTEEEARAEAAATFRDDELANDPAVVCEDCWQAMRVGMPDLDARYKEAGL